MCLDIIYFLYALQQLRGIASISRNYNKNKGLRKEIASIKYFPKTLVGYRRCSEFIKQGTVFGLFIVQRFVDTLLIGSNISWRESNVKYVVFCIPRETFRSEYDHAEMSHDYIISLPDKPPCRRRPF